MPRTSRRFECASRCPLNNEMAVRMQAALRSRSIELPDDEALVTELENLRMLEVAPNVYKVEHDADKHNDRFVCIGLAYLDLVGRSLELPRLSPDAFMEAARTSPFSEDYGAHRSSLDDIFIGEGF